MATPHYLPAVPTASAIAVGRRSSELLRFPAEVVFLQDLRSELAAGATWIRLVISGGIDPMRLGLAAALEVGGNIVVVTSSPSRRSRWRRVSRQHRSVGPPKADAAFGEPPQLRCVTSRQLYEMRLSEETQGTSHDAMRTVSTLVLDLEGLRVREEEALNWFLSHHAAHLPRVLVLASSGELAASIPAVVLQPGLLAEEGRLARYRLAHWLVPRDGYENRQMDELRRELCLRVRQLAPSRGATLREFVTQQLPRSPRRSVSLRRAYLHRLAREGDRTRAYLSVFVWLGGSLPPAVEALVGDTMDSAKPPIHGLRTVLPAFAEHLEASKAPVGLRRELRAILSLLERVAAPPPSDATPRAIARLVGRGQQRGRSLVVTDDEAQGGKPVRLAERLQQRDLRCGVVSREGVAYANGERWLHIAEACLVNTAVVSLARMLEDDRLDAIVAPQGLVHSIAAGLASARVNIDRVFDSRNHPSSTTPVLASPFLSSELAFRSDEPLLLWRAVEIDLGDPRCALERVQYEAQKDIRRSSAGLVQGDPALRRLGRTRIDGSTIRRFNRASWMRASCPEHRKELVGVVHKGVEVRTRAADPPLLSVATGGLPGLPMSLSRAHRRRRHYLTKERQAIFRAVVASALMAFTIPSLAGPVIGGLVAAVGTVLFLCRLARQLHSLRRRHLFRPSSSTRVVRDFAAVVLRTLRVCGGFDARRLPTSRIRLAEAEGIVTVWLDTPDRRAAELFSSSLSEALGPVGAHRYIIGRAEAHLTFQRRFLLQSLSTHMASYHPVPSLLGASRESAELYAGYWSQVFGRAKLRYASGGKGRLLRYAHFGRNELGLDSEVVTLLR